MKLSTTLLSSVVIAAMLAACSPKPETATAPAETPAAAPAAPAAIAESADVKPFTIGSLQAAALRDGTLSPANDNKTLAVGRTKEETDALLVANNLPTDTLSLGLQPMLVRGADKVMLFDTGAAANMGPAAGKLPASLAAAGVDPASVTDVFISHLHRDHVGGLVANGVLAFPNAAIRMSTDEWAALQHDEQQAALVSVISPKVTPFEPNAEIVPGLVKSVDVDGHTPGHTAYEITSDGQSLLYIGDTMHHSVISVQRPDWTIAFDGDAPTAQASRKALLERTAASGERIYAVHFPFPGLGKFEKQGDTFVWVAEQ